MGVYTRKGVFDKSTETDAGTSGIKGGLAVSEQKDYNGVHVELGDQSLRNCLELNPSESMASGGG
jgi:hypothetical protein